jgi:FMN phosphatase YigB (HAD superfamily)
MTPDPDLKLILFDLGGVLWQLEDPIDTFDNVADTFGHRFDRYFRSYETGLLKPDAHAFINALGSLC